MGSVFAAAQPSPEPKRRSPSMPAIQQKEVLLFEWWLKKAEKGYNGRWLTVGGFTKRGDAVGIFRSAPIIKRHDQCTLETTDGMTIRIQGPINKTRTIDNGFPFETSKAFLFGFPTTWDNFAKESSNSKMLEHQPETTFDPSFLQKTVLLRNWWLRKAEESDGSRLAVSGFTECGKAMRVFDSSPIIKRHDAYTIDTADGITIRIEGFINKIRTLDNGFSLEVCKTFLIGFPTSWSDFSIDSSRDKSSQAEISVIASSGADQPKDSLENVNIGFPAKAENNISFTVSSSSNTFVRDCDTRLREAIHKFSALVSMFNPVEIDGVDRGSCHLQEKSFCDDNGLQEDVQLQDDKSSGTNLRDADTGYNDYEAGHTPVDNDSENLEIRFTEGVHTEGAGCLTDGLHVDGLLQEISLNHENLEFIQDAALNICKKCNGHALKKCDHDEGVGTRSTTNLLDSVVGKDHQKEETDQKTDEMFDECSTRRPEKVKLGVSKVENLHGDVQKCAKFAVKSVRRSPRLESLNHLENVLGEFQHNSQFLNETNDMKCANLVPKRSKTCISQPTDAIAEGCSSSPNLCVVRLGVSKVENLQGEVQKCDKFAVKSVRRSPRLKLLNHPESVLGEFQYNSQFLNEKNDMKCANLVQKRSKTCISQPTDTIAEGCSTSPSLSVDAQKFVKSLAKPVRESEGFHGECQGYSQFLDEINNMNDANLSRSRSKTHARKPNCNMLKGSPLTPTSNVLLPSAGVLSEENQYCHQDSINMCLGVPPHSNSASKYVCCDDSTSTAFSSQTLNDNKNSSSDCIAGPVEETPANSEAVTSQTVEKLKLRCSRKNKDNQTDRSRMKIAQNDFQNQLSGPSFEENNPISSSNSRRTASHLTPISDKSSTMRKFFEFAKHAEVSTETQQAEDKLSQKIGYKTFWVSSYADGTPLTRYQKKKSSILTPESLNLKRSRSGRLLIPRLDCSLRIIYEPDGSFTGTAPVDGSCTGTASVEMSTTQCKGSGTKLDREKRKK